MGKPFSLDLRHRICAYVSAGNACRSAGRVFGVSAATAVRYVAEHREHGEVIAKPQGRPVGQFGKLVAYVDFLTDLVQAGPDITLQELANALENTYGVNVHLSSIHRILVGSGFSYKKRAYRPGAPPQKGSRRAA